MRLMSNTQQTEGGSVSNTASSVPSQRAPDGSALRHDIWENGAPSQLSQRASCPTKPLMKRCTDVSSRKESASQQKIALSAALGNKNRSSGTDVSDSTRRDRDGPLQLHRAGLGHASAQLERSLEGSLLSVDAVKAPAQFERSLEGSLLSVDAVKASGRLARSLERRARQRRKASQDVGMSGQTFSAGGSATKWTDDFEVRGETGGRARRSVRRSTVSSAGMMDFRSSAMPLVDGPEDCEKRFVQEDRFFIDS